MIFGATWACTRCALRFTRRDSCPSCGGAVVSLSDRDARTKLQRTQRAGGAPSFLLLLGQWAPSRPWITIGIGVLLMVPSLYALIFAPSSLLTLWLVDDRSNDRIDLHTEYDGLSRHGFEILALGGAGLVLTAFTALALLGRRARPAPPAKKLRLHESEASNEGREEVTGLAKLATAELQSPLGAEPCLAYGLHGDVDGVPVDDADGGDFDLVLPDGAVVMVSLEHAKLEPSGDEKAIPLTPDEAADLEDFLLERVGQRVREACTLAETFIAEGDTVTILGDFQGNAIGTAPFRGAARSRVLGGTAARPLVVRVAKRTQQPE